MAINRAFTFGRDPDGSYPDEFGSYLDGTDVAPEVEYDVYANFGRWPIVAIVPDVGEWFDRRDRSLAAWPAGWLHFQGATSCLREYGRERTRRKGRYRRTRRRSRRDSALLPERLCKVRHRRAGGAPIGPSDREKIFAILYVPEFIPSPCIPLVRLSSSNVNYPEFKLN